MLPKIHVNPNPEELKKISEAIFLNGGYCCCALEHTPDTICPCTDFKASYKTGRCECGRYYKVVPRSVVTICGSTRFKDEIIERARELTKEGYLVFMPHFFGHDGDDVSDIKEMLDDIHKAKIEKSDMIYVVNPDGYVGEST